MIDPDFSVFPDNDVIDPDFSVMPDNGVIDPDFSVPPVWFPGGRDLLSLVVTVFLCRDRHADSASGF